MGVEPDGPGLRFPSGLALDAIQLAVVIDDDIVLGVVSEGNRDVVSTSYKLVDDFRLGLVSDVFRVTVVDTDRPRWTGSLSFKNPNTSFRHDQTCLESLKPANGKVGLRSARVV